MTNRFSIGDILRDSDYALDLFSQQEINSLEMFEKRGKPYIKDFATDTDRPAKPEEIVRQLYLYRLIHTYRYPTERIDVEKSVWFGSTVAKKRADIVVSDKNDPSTAYIIVEVKKPKRQDGIEQLKSYCNAEGAPIAVWTNGQQEADSPTMHHCWQVCRSSCTAKTRTSTARCPTCPASIRRWRMSSMSGLLLMN